MYNYHAYKLYLVIFENSDIFVICMNKFTMALSFPNLPSAYIFCASGSICVGSLAMSLMILPFSFICVTIYIGVFTKSTSLIIYPAS